MENQECVQKYGPNPILPTLPDAIQQLVEAGKQSLTAKRDARRREQEEEERRRAAEVAAAWDVWEGVVRRLLPAEVVGFARFDKVRHEDKGPGMCERIAVEIPSFEALGFNVIKKDGEITLSGKEFEFFDLRSKEPDYLGADHWTVETDRNRHWKTNDLAEALAIAEKLGRKRVALQAECDQKNAELQARLKAADDDLSEETRRAVDQAEKESDAAQSVSEAEQLESDVRALVRRCDGAGPRMLNMMLIEALRALAYSEGVNACSNWGG